MVPQLTYTDSQIPRKWVAFYLHILEEVEMMKNTRAKFYKRRQNEDMLRVPFKDDRGATIIECRRRITDRRIANV
jgi:hypothetical protein